MYDDQALVNITSEEAGSMMRSLENSDSLKNVIGKR